MDNLIWLYRAVAAYTTKLQTKLHHKTTKELITEKLKFDHIHGAIHKDFKNKKDTFEYWSERLATETDFITYLKEQADV